MVQINQQHLIGSMIPDVYIKNITLESGGYYQKESNPHIQHARENTVVSDSATQAMKINLSLSVKDTLSGGIAATWFSQQNFKKYISVTVVQCTHPLITKVMSSSNNAIRLANAKSNEQKIAFLYELLETIKAQPDMAAYGLDGEDYQALGVLFENNTSVKTFSLNEITHNKELLTKEYKSVSSTGGVVYDICHNIEFNTPSDKPDHLAYFAASSINLQLLKDEFDIFIDNPYFTDLLSGKVTSDIVFNNSSLVSNATVFTDSSAAVWTGPVHKTSEGVWLSGTPADIENNILTKNIVPNNKLQDFRIAQQIEKLKFDFAKIDNQLLAMPNSSFSNLKNKQALPDSQGVYFTDLSMTIDLKHNAKFIFGIDYNKVVRENSLYGNLYKGTYNEAKLLELVTIRSVILKRRRIKKGSTVNSPIGSPGAWMDLFDKDAPDEVLLRTSFKKKNKDSSPRGSLKEIDLSHPGLRHFMGVDKTMSFTTDGHYKYGVEIELEDKTHTKIINTIKGLSETKANFDAYAEKALLSQNYDIIANRFTQKYIEEQDALYTTDMSKPWNQMVYHYAITMAFFKSMPENITIFQNLLQMAAPATGNPRGIMMLQNLIEKFIARIAEITGTKMEVSSGGGTTLAKMPKKPSPRTIKVEHFFKETIDSNFPKKIGFDYLSNGPTAQSFVEDQEDADSLKPITWKDYTARADSESTKYFIPNTTKIEITSDSGMLYNPGDNLNTTKWTYLTPSNINLGKSGGTCLLAQPFDVTKNANVSSAIMSLNLSKKSPFLPPVGFFNDTVEKKPSQKTPPVNQLATSTNKNLVNAISQFNCTIIPAKAMSYLSALESPSAIVGYDLQDPYVDASELMGYSWDDIDVLSGSYAETERSAISDEGLGDPVSVLSYLLEDSMLESYGSFNQSSIPATGPPPSAIPKQQNKIFYSSAFYDPSAGGNAIEKAIAKLPSGGSSLQPATPTSFPAAKYSSATPTFPSVQKMIANLPNQIKSLFLSATPIVKQNWLADKDADMLQAPLMLPTVAINYKMIMQVQALVGYKTNTGGGVSLKDPVWAPLTSDLKIILAAKRDLVLCRLHKYENLDFGIKQPKGLSLPTYNEYFILNLQSSPSQLIIAPQTQYKETLLKKLITTGKAGDIPTEYTSTNIVQGINIIPSIKAKAQAKNGYKIL